MHTKIRIFSILLCLVLASCATPGGVPVELRTPSAVHAPDRMATPTIVSGQQIPALSIPDLIEAALAKGEITAEQRLLYLAYALYEPVSLPEQYRSDVPWRGTMYVREIKTTVTSTEILCVMLLEIRQELQRIVPGSVTCP